MKSVLMTLIFSTVLTIAAVAAAPPSKEMAVVDLPDKTLLVKAVLQGKYIFVHDDSKMSKNEPCFYVYEFTEDKTGQPEVRQDKLVTSFHCQPVQHDKARQIVLTYGMTSGGMLELREIQFEGSTEGHRVP
jgi:hypothetical protein